MNISTAGATEPLPEPSQLASGSDGLQKMSPELKAITLRFSQLQADGKPHPVEAGKMLLQAKNLLGHGNFLGWLAGHFHLSAKSANRLMSVAQLFQQFQSEADSEHLLQQLDNSALYELAAKSTPADIQHYVLSLLRAGESVSYSDIRLLKGQPQIRQMRDREVLLRFMSLLDSFKIWFDANRSELRSTLSRLDEQGHQQLAQHARSLAEACALLDALLATTEAEKIILPAVSEQEADSILG